MREPDVTGTTVAPSSSMRKTLSSWRTVSTSPMKTVHSSPSRAAPGGGGDAVLARAGLGDDARLAHALGEQRLADDVVDLVRAGVREVFALGEEPQPERSESRGSGVTGVGRPTNSASVGGTPSRKRDRSTRRERPLPVRDRRASAPRGRIGRRSRRSARAHPVRP